MTKFEAFCKLSNNSARYRQLTDEELKIDALLQDLVMSKYIVEYIVSGEIHFGPDDIFKILSKREGYSFEETIEQIIGGEYSVNDILEEYVYDLPIDPTDVEAFKIEQPREDFSQQAN
jgi:hypothetical protein